MAVIYLPQDPRMQVWGQAIDNFVNGWVTARQRKRIQDAYDSGETDPEKLEALAGGDPDLEQYVEHIVKGQTAKSTLATQETERQARQQEIEASKHSMAIQDQEQARAETLLPGQLLEQAAQVRAQNATAALQAAEARGIPSEINARNAAAAASVAAAQATQQEMAIKAQMARELTGSGGGEGDDEQAGPTQATGSFTPLSATPVGQQLGATSPGPRKMAASGGGSFLQGLNPDEKQLMMTSLAAKGLGPAVTTEREIIKDREAQQVLHPLPTAQVNLVTGAGQMNVDMNTFLDQLPQTDTGGAFGKLENLSVAYGIDLSWLTKMSSGGHLAFATADEAMKNLLQHSATSGSGFMSKERIDLASGIQPGPLKDRLVNLISSGVGMSSLLAQLEAVRGSYANSNKPKYDLTELDRQIQQTMQSIKRLDHFYTDDKTGAVVDMDRVKELIPNGSVTTLSGKKITPEFLRDIMVKMQGTSGGTQGVTPDQVLQQLLHKY